MSKSDLLNQVAGYYSGKISEFGPTPRGVDWNGAHGQEIRFRQLCRIIEADGGFSVNDLGCGYGALYDFLRCERKDFEYFGTDVSEDMIRAARSRIGDAPGVRLAIGSEFPAAADYAVASGIFNVRLGYGDAAWQEYLELTLDVLHRGSSRGFAFNCLTSYSDPEHMRDDLYYADPRRMFDHCKQHYSRNVALLHDYNLYEFTMLVRKD